MDLQNMFASNLSLSKIKLRPAHCPGQTRLCLLPLALAPHKLVASQIGSSSRILLPSALSTLFRKISTKFSTNHGCHKFSLLILLLGSAISLRWANSGPSCSLNSLRTGVSVTCSPLVGLLSIWNHNSSLLQLPILSHLLKVAQLAIHGNIDSDAPSHPFYYNYNYNYNYN